MNRKNLALASLLLVSAVTAGTVVLSGSGSAAAAAASGTPAAPAAAPLGSEAVEHVTLEVEGVTCAGCSVAIRKALRKLDGVRTIEEGTSKKRLTVGYAAGTVTVSAIVEAVRKAGFEARAI